MVESVKAASDIYAPISGEIVAVNEELSSAPEKINQDAYAAWMFKLKPTNPGELNALLDAVDTGSWWRQMVSGDGESASGKRAKRESNPQCPWARLRVLRCSPSLLPPAAGLGEHALHPPHRGRCPRDARRPSA